MSQCTLPTREAVQPSEYKSVQDQGEEEARRYKWIESEKAGRDLGEGAIRSWVREHWNGFLRARWLEHLQGLTYWIELDQNDFGLLRTEFRDPWLLGEILQQLKTGQENLNVLIWALDNRLPMGDVLEILEALDINSRRIKFLLGSPTSHAD